MKRLVCLLLVLGLQACAPFPKEAKNVGIVSNFGDELLYQNRSVSHSNSTVDVSGWGLDAFATASFSKALKARGYTPFAPEVDRSQDTCDGIGGSMGDRLKQLIGTSSQSVDLWVFIHSKFTSFGGCGVPLVVYPGDTIWHPEVVTDASIDALIYLIDGKTF